MMMKVSLQNWLHISPNVEIIELHHNHKYDAPSGTSILTAKLINEAKLLRMQPAEDLTS